MGISCGILREIHMKTDNMFLGKCHLQKSFTFKYIKKITCNFLHATWHIQSLYTTFWVPDDMSTKWSAYDLTIKLVGHYPKMQCLSTFLSVYRTILQFAQCTCQYIKMQNKYTHKGNKLKTNIYEKSVTEIIDNIWIDLLSV